MINRKADTAGYKAVGDERKNERMQILPMFFKENQMKTVRPRAFKGGHGKKGSSNFIDRGKLL